MKCERCGALWHQDYTPGDPEPETASVTILLKKPVGEEGMTADREVNFDVLCTKCEETVTNYVDSVDRDPEARKKAGAKKKGGGKGDGAARPPKPPTPPSAGARPASSEAPDRSS